VLREYLYLGTSPTWVRDHTYQNGLMLTVERPAGTLWTILDHLGTPVVYQDANHAALLMTNFLFSYGEDQVSKNPADIGSPKRFTGHERDQNLSFTEIKDDLDYMHARHYSPHMGRFMSTDPGKDWSGSFPQSWNLYTYARSNPANGTDPTGRCTDPGGSGIRFCIQSFIPHDSVLGFVGDSRGASPDGGTFRTNHSVFLDGRSPTFEAGVSIWGPYAERGFVHGHLAVAYEGSIFAAAAAGDGLGYGFAPPLHYNLTVVPDGEGGYDVSGTHSAFPSFEVWVYDDEGQPRRVYVHNASASNWLEALIGLTTTVDVEKLDVENRGGDNSNGNNPF
jgi:RHS repeat-associated protein